MKPLDLLGRRFLLACLGLFLIGFAFKLNGSSSLMWREELHDNKVGGGLILGTPRLARSDEWLVWTPALLWQCDHGFPAENPSLGAGKAPFLYSLPVKDYTALSRPQLYGFFLFNSEWGYAWYWNVKVFGLLSAMFLLFWTLTNNSRLSIFGALCVFFSNYIQWWFSCPPMLPEMLSSWALALVCAITLVDARSWLRCSILAGAFILCAVNFLLCLYPPFQIPLLYFGIVLFVGRAWSRDPEMSRETLWRGPAFLLLALAGVVALLLPFFFELKPTLDLLSSTSYPGHRRSHGGELSWLRYFSGLMNLLDTPLALRTNFAQANETANFFPLWIPAVAVTGRSIIAQPRKHADKIACLVVIVFLSIYALCPLPWWITNSTLLSFCTEVRALVVIGLANIFFVVISLPLLRSCVVNWSATAVGGLVALFGGLIWFYLHAATAAYPLILNSWRLWIFLVLDVGMLMLLLKMRARIFALSLVTILVVTNGLVNPVMTGLGSILRATPTAAIGKLIREHPGDGWAAFESNQLSEFLMASGARVVSGLKIVPDLEFYRTIDSKGEWRPIYNRYSFAFFLFRADRDAAGVRSFTPPSHLVGIHPLNEAMKEHHVRYFLFPEPFGQPAKEGMELVLSFPNNHIWIYQPDGAPAL